MNEKLKNVKYICSNCGYSEIKIMSKDSHPEVIIHCPECRRITFERHDPTYIERMKDASNI